MSEDNQTIQTVETEQSEVQETITDKQVQRKKRTPRKGGVDMVLTAKKDKKGLLWVQFPVTAENYLKLKALKLTSPLTTEQYTAKLIEAHLNHLTAQGRFDNFNFITDYVPSEEVKMTDEEIGNFMRDHSQPWPKAS